MEVFFIGLKTFTAARNDKRGCKESSSADTRLPFDRRIRGMVDTDTSLSQCKACLDCWDRWIEIPRWILLWREDWQVESTHENIFLLTAINTEEASLVSWTDEINIFPLPDDLSYVVMSGRKVLPEGPMWHVLDVFNYILPILVVAFIGENLKLENCRIQRFHFAKVSDIFPHRFRFHILDYFFNLVSLITRKEEEIDEDHSTDAEN